MSQNDADLCKENGMFTIKGKRVVNAVLAIGLMLTSAFALAGGRIYPYGATIADDMIGIDAEGLYLCKGDYRHGDYLLAVLLPDLAVDC